MPTKTHPAAFGDLFGSLFGPAQGAQNQLAPLVFEDVQLQVIDRDGAAWLRVGQIAQALGYADGRDCTKLYERHSDEFTVHMTAVVKLPTAGGVQSVRIFSLRGAYALAMFSKTDTAKRFRIWLLDILEGKAPAPVAPMPRPATAPSIEPSAEQVLIEELKAQSESIKDKLIATQARLLEVLDTKKPKRATSRPVSEADIQRMRRLHQQGLSNSAIAKATQRSTATVSWAVRSPA